MVNTWELPTASGVYYILNLRTGRHYVGSSVDLRKRWRRHQRALEAGSHHNSKLQNAWVKYGARQFDFRVIELACVETLAEREQFWIDQTLPFYNILRFARSAFGYRHKTEAIERMRRVQSSRTDRHRQLLGQAAKGRRPTNETKWRISVAKVGRKMSQETCERMSLAKRNQVISQEQRNKIAVANSKTYEVTSPDGDTEIVCNLTEFCRIAGLNQSLLSAVANGKRQHHKGWRARLKGAVDEQ